MENYKVAGITLRLDCDEESIGAFGKQLLKFKADSKESPDIAVTVLVKEHIEMPAGILLMDEYLKWVRKPDGGFFISINASELREILVLIDTDAAWEKIIISVPKYIPGMDADERAHLVSGNVFFMLGLIFRNKILQYDGFVIHASSIDYNGSGITFSAPSGTGKSTHVNLWTSYYGDATRIVNDDTPAIRIQNGVPILFGTPWCGSSFIGENASVPLRAMVAIERGQTNVIHRLTVKEALTCLFPRVMLPYYDDCTMEAAIRTVETVLKAVPCYRLTCTIDREAVELVRQCVM